MTVLARMREVAVHRRNNRSDWILLGTIVALSAFGLLMIYSATRSSGTFSMERQMVFVAAGLIIFMLASNIDYREFRGIVPFVSGHLESGVRVGAKTQDRLLASPAISEPPPATARWLNLQYEAATIGKAVCLVSRLGIVDVLLAELVEFRHLCITP